RPAQVLGAPARARGPWRRRARTPPDAALRAARARVSSRPDARRGLREATRSGRRAAERLRGLAGVRSRRAILSAAADPGHRRRVAAGALPGARGLRRV